MTLTIQNLDNAELDTDHIAAIATSTALTATDRLGHNKRTLAGTEAYMLDRAAAQRAQIQQAADLVLGQAGYAPPVLYAAGLSLTLQTQTVEYAGNVYAPKIAALPFVTGSTFDASKFRLIQGVASTDLALATGADMIGAGPGNTIADVIAGLGIALSATSATRNAAEDTAGLQALLDRRGLVVLPPPAGGYYLLNNSLVIRDKTTLVLLPGAQLKQDANINKSLIVNECVNRPWSDITGNVVWPGGAGFRVLITWGGHGLQVGDAVWLDCQNSFPYCGIFTVEELQGANDFIVRLDREPLGNPVGTVRIKRADVDIEVHGLDLDYNAAQNTDGAQTPMTHASIFAGIRGFELQGVKGRNTKKYLVCTAGLKNFNIDGVQGYRLNSDMVKIYGPAHHGEVMGLTGQSGDDMLSFQPREYDAFAPYRLSYGGDVIDVRANVRMTGGEDGVAVAASFYPYPGAVIDAIELVDFAGYADGTGISIYQYEGASGYIGTIKVRNFNLRCKHPLRATQAGGTSGPTNIKHLDFEVGPQCRALTGAAIIDIDNGVTIEDLTIRGADVSPANLPAIGQSPLLTVQGTGDVTGAIVLDSVNWRVAASYLLNFSGAAKSFRTLDFYGCDVETTYDLVHGSALLSNDPTITVHGGHLKSYFLFEVQSACRINLLGARLTPSQKVLNAYGDSVGVIVLNAVGVKLANGEWFNANGGKKVAPRSFEIVANLESDYLQRAAGNMVTSSGTAGTIPALVPCICAGTGANSWHSIADPANQKY